MRFLSFILLLGIILLPGITGTAFSQSVREHRNFDEGWKFHLGHASDPHRDFNYGGIGLAA